MSEQLALATRYAERHPALAARVLEQQAADSAAAALDAMPPKTAAVVLGAMLPRYAADRLSALEPASAGEVLARLDPGSAAMILRQLSERRSSRLVEAMPGRSALPLRLVLRYPASMIGAWMDVGVIVLPVEDRAGEALQRARSSTLDLDRLLYVVDREQRPQGTLRAAQLLRADGKTPLQELMGDIPFVLRARVDLRAAENHPGWSRADPLPVINRERRLVGVLHHVDLQRGLHSAYRDHEPAIVVTDSLVEWLDLSWQGMATLLEASLRLMPSEPGPERSGQSDA